MKQEAFRTTLRELVHCYQAFERYAGIHIHQQGLTIPQFDLLVTLGNRGDMTPKELVQHTLITKGTLTGVIDRLLLKGLINRHPSTIDKRSYVINLAPKGRALFEKVFPSHLTHMSQAFSFLPLQEINQIQTALNKLRLAFETQKAKTTHPEEKT